MIRHDYIMRMIEQLARKLAQVIFNKERIDDVEAGEAIRDASTSFVGVDYLILLTTPVEDLLKLFSLGGDLEVNKAYAAAELLAADGFVRDKHNDGPGAALRYQKALLFYLACYESTAGDVKQNLRAAIEKALERSSEYEYSGVLKARLIGYHESEGRFSQAEDLLFELKDAGEPGVAELGRAFYKRLLRKKDFELEEGDLPRAEVEEGLRELGSP